MIASGQKATESSWQKVNSSDFSRVTLVYEEEQQVEAHKVILAATSPYTRNSEHLVMWSL